MTKIPNKTPRHTPPPPLFCSQACFDRRFLPREQQPRVWLNTSELKHRLAVLQAEHDQLVAPLLEAGWSADEFDVVTTEALLGHQAKNGTDTLDAAVDAWSRLLTSLAIAPDPEVIRPLLKQGSEAVHIPPQGSRPHEETLFDALYNPRDVQHLLQGAGGVFSKFWWDPKHP